MGRFSLSRPHPNLSPLHAVKKSRQTIKGMKTGRIDEILAHEAISVEIELAVAAKASERKG
jgi:hypothetical protein